jgi:hypothetical protein
MLKNLSRKNKIIKDSFKLKQVKRPYSKDENSTVLERVGFPQRKEKNKRNLARISFYVKKKFEKQFNETNTSFLNYINKHKYKSTSSLPRGLYKISSLSPAPELNESNYNFEVEN